MKKFLIDLVLFCAIILLLAWVVDMLVSQGLRHTPKNHLETMNMVMNDSPNYDVLILGNSRGACGYSPYILDSVLGCNSYNMSVSGKAFRISNLRYQAYRRNNAAPRLIIMNIDQLQLGERNLGYENYMFYPYITDTLVRPILEMNHFSWLDIHVPMYRYRGDYKYICLGLLEVFHLYHLPGEGYKGYLPNPNGSWDGTEMREVIQRGGPHRIGSLLDSAVLEIADSFLAQAKAEGVEVVMVYAPLYCQIQENMYPAHFNALMSAYYDLSQKYDVPILDYRAMPMNNDSTYFKDGNHLCQIGAELFTTHLAHDLDSLHLY